MNDTESDRPRSGWPLVVAFIRIPMIAIVA